MQTSGLRSLVPPKYVATRSPFFVSAIVAEWHSGNEALVYRNSSARIWGSLVGSFWVKEYFPEPVSLVVPSGMKSVAVVLAGISTSQCNVPFCFLQWLVMLP